VTSPSFEVPKFVHVELNKVPGNIWKTLIFYFITNEIGIHIGNLLPK
jgi:hypothetical protein